MVAFLTGPTAVGKSEVALALARRHRWAILSLDSRQIYRGLELGTAKPSHAERREIPHFLIDLLDPREACSAGRFRQLFQASLRELATSNLRGLAVGGSGFYWEACSLGLHPLPPASSKIRERHDAIVAEEGIEGLRNRLRLVDPEAALRLSPRDRHRIGRALEVAELTGEPLSRLLSDLGREGPTAPAPVITLRRTREDLYARIRERCHRMIRDGLIEEVRGLLAQGLPADAPGFRTVGYREFLPFLLGDRTEAEAVELFVRNSRRYAKRQETWFRHRLPDRIELLLASDEPADRTVDRVEVTLKLRTGETRPRSSEKGARSSEAEARSSEPEARCSNPEAPDRPAGP